MSHPNTLKPSSPQAFDAWLGDNLPLISACAEMHQMWQQNWSARMVGDTVYTDDEINAQREKIEALKNGDKPQPPADEVKR